MSAASDTKKHFSLPLVDLMAFLEQDLQDVYSLGLDAALVFEHLQSLKAHLESEASASFIDTRNKSAVRLAEEISISLTKAMALIHPGGCIDAGCINDLATYLGDLVDKIPLLQAARAG